MSKWHAPVNLARLAGEPWTQFFDRLRVLARDDCKNRHVPFVDPLP